MTSVRIDLDKSGISDLLASSGVQSDLAARAARIAQVASSRGIRVGDTTGGAGEIALPINVVDASNSTRARVLIVADHPAGLAVEAKHRLLVSSLDAAR